MRIKWKLFHQNAGRKYYVSDQGSIKSITKGNVTRHYTASLHWTGYKYFSLCIDKKSKPLAVHELVMSAFETEPKKKRSVNHINGIKSDNRLINLERSTPQEQVDHYQHNIKNIKQQLPHNIWLHVNADGQILREYETSKEAIEDNGSEPINKVNTHTYRIGTTIVIRKDYYNEKIRFKTLDALLLKALE